jgi:hypothetical protein
MANELSVNIRAQLAKDNLKESFAPGNKRIDVDTVGAHGTVVTVGQAAEEDMPVGDVTTLGWLCLENLDDTNYVTWGPKSGTMVPLGRLEPGEPASLRLEPGITLTWQADTADVQVKMLLIED